MSNMSFSATIEPVRSKVKRVTRRTGWSRLRAGDVVQPVERCMGIAKGEKVKPIGGPIRILSVKPEPLCSLLQDPEYAARELVLEGFGESDLDQFMRLLKRLNPGISPETEVKRIEFEYLPEQQTLGF